MSRWHLFVVLCSVAALSAPSSAGTPASAGQGQQNVVTDSVAISSCIDKWRTSREINANQLSTQTAESLIAILSRTRPAILTSGCEGLNVVLDKVRSDASNQIGAHVVFGTGTNTIDLNADFQRESDRMVISGDGLSLSGTSSSNVLSGTYVANNRPRTLRISNLSYETAAGAKEPAQDIATDGTNTVIRGTVSKAPSPISKSEEMTITLEPRSAPSLDEYVLYHLPATGEQFCGGPPASCGGYADETWSRLVKWTDDFVAGHIGYVYFDFTPPPALTVSLDGDPVPDFLREMVIAANEDHVVKAMNGSQVYWSKTFQVKPNGIYHCPDTGAP